MAAIDDLLVALGSNSELRDAIMTATTLETAIEIADKAGFKIEGKDLCNAHKNQMLELSDQELETIAGGKATDTKGGVPCHPLHTESQLELCA